MFVRDRVYAPIQVTRNSLNAYNTAYICNVHVALLLASAAT
jgi:hypothetical protein